MTDAHQTGTNAADTAPGVDDGRTSRQSPNHTTKPGGRGKVWIWLLLSLAVLLAVYVATPKGSQEQSGDMVSVGGDRTEMNSSTVPGAANSAPQR
jgi:hypothetical protein